LAPLQGVSFSRGCLSHSLHFAVSVIAARATFRLTLWLACHIVAAN